MANDLINVENPFGSPQGGMTAGVQGTMARENAEVLAMAVMAKRFPRNQMQCAERIRMAFTRTNLAEKAQYQFARGGTDISGPSIRAAEAMAQAWQNLSSGWNELSRSIGPDGVGVSEVEAFCVDYESVSRESIKFTVRHWRDTKTGGYKLKDERDIYELCANQAQRRKRACILAQLPGDVIDMAMEQAEVTLKSKADTSPEAMKKMVEAFAAFGVTKEHIEKKIQRRLDAIQPAQVVMLKRIYASLRDDMSTPSEWFETEDDKPAGTAPAAGSAGLKAAMAGGATGSTAPGSSGGATGSASSMLAAGTAASQANPVTGETTPPPAGAKAAADKTAAAKPAAKTEAKKADDGAPKKTYAQFVDGIQTATSAETAALELDAARGVLTDLECVDLAGVYGRRWPTKS